MKGLRIGMVAGALLAAPLAAVDAQQQQPPPPAPASPSVQSSGRAAGVEVAAGTVIGARVRDTEGNELGAVSQLMIEPQQGRITSVVIKRGGTLGIGGQEMAVPWETVKVQRDGNDVVLTVQQPVLEQAPRQQGQGQQDRQDKRSDPSASPATGQDRPNSERPRR